MEITLEQFKQEWLKDIVNASSPLEKGRKFALKLFTQWLELGVDSEIYQCDGAYDGGIDLAYYEPAPTDDDNVEGATWYFVQSKYGTSFNGSETIATEANKIFETLEGQERVSSSIAQNVVEQFQMFRRTANEKDKIFIIFATNDEMQEAEIRALKDAEIAGRARFGNLLNVCSISIENIYNRLEESEAISYKIPIYANLVISSSELLVGSIKLSRLYEFMQSYRETTNDLELLYQKNVRKFLGSRKKVNKGIAQTLMDNPERFGIYNNGITFVVDDFEQEETDKYNLINPYIVNGCQTTRTIWEVLAKRLEKIGSGVDEELEKWKEKLSKGVVIAKVVKIGNNGSELLNNTTKYTNSQNAVSAKDFIALEQNFQDWSTSMQKKYRIFLEIQRGAWDSKKIQRQLQPNRPDLQFNGFITAIDALKVYAAGWLGLPGVAYGQTPPFAPGGFVFKKIIDNENFSVEDLYAAYLLRELTTKMEFGKRSPFPSIGKGRYLFYMVLINLLKECMTSSMLYDAGSDTDVTKCVIKLFDGSNPDEAGKIYKQAFYVIEQYFDNSKSDSIYYEEFYNGDINGCLKKDYLGRRDKTAKLYNLIAVTNYIMRTTGDLDSIKNIL